MFTSWKSTLAGLLTALFAFVLFSPETFQAWPWLIALAKFAVVGGLAGMGIVGKDSGVSGGSADLRGSQGPTGPPTYDPPKPWPDPRGPAA